MKNIFKKKQQKQPEIIESTTIYPSGMKYETYPKVTECPECHSKNGHQSFDIWICMDCGQWPYIPPIESRPL